MKLFNPNFMIIIDPEEEFPYVIAKNKGTVNYSRKVVRKKMLEAGSKPFRFKPNSFNKYADFGEGYEEHPCFYFDFVSKAHRKTIKQIEGEYHE